MKRILHLLDTTGPGGAETVYLSLITSLGSEWESIPVVAGPGWVEDSVRTAGFSPLLISSGGRFDFRYLSALRSAVRKHRIDLIQSHLFSTTLYGGLAGFLGRVPVVGTFHGEPDLRAQGAAGTLRYRLIRTCTRKVVCVGSSLKELAIRKGGFRPDDLEVIPNGIDTSRYSPGDGSAVRQALGLSSDTFLVGSVGNVRPAKDYETLLRTAKAVKELSGDAVHFVIAGETTPPLFDDLMAMRSQMDLEKAVSFLGFREDIPQLMRALDLFLLTSEFEGFSLVVVQAMATTLPVVATRCGGPEEILTSGEDGILCPIGDESALAESIMRLRADTPLKEQLAGRARKTAVARFSKDAMVRSYERLYRGILGMSAPGPGPEEVGDLRRH